MSATEDDRIEKRLTRLEREVKYWKRTAIATMVLLAVLIVCGSGPRARTARAADSSAKDLVARSLKIVDEQGTPRVVLTADKDETKLELRDEKGKPQAVLLAEKGGTLNLSGEKGILPGTTLGDGALWLRDEKGTTLVTLEAAGDGPFLMLSDLKGTVRADLAADKNGPALVLDDEKGKPRAVFGSAQLESPRSGATEQTGPGSVTLFDKSGKTIWRAP